MEKPFRAYKGTEPYIFVTYAHSNADAVYPEMAWLNGKGVHVWYDEGIEPGTTWRTEIAEAIENAKVVLYFISSASAVSEHCLREISYALDNKIAVLPVYLEDTPLPPDLRLGLSRIQAIYLTEYQTDDYRDKLLHAIADQQAHTDTLVGRKSRPRIPRVAAYLVALIVLLIGVGAIQQVGIFSGVSVAHASVAVLPFESWSADPNDEFITLGLTEEILNSLTQVDGLMVTSRTSSFAFKNKDVDIKEIAGRLGVRYLLEGSFKKSDNEFRVLVQLIDAQTGFQKWTASY
ncbi:MAG: TIR domain-containing protein, partial [Gammaproteobacteria bacterium]|nr:TIR domain-containing protein [Gammaproteobacteria bacterium]